MPPLAYAQDMPLDELRTAELLLVATLRLFAEDAWREWPRSDWQEGLVTAGVTPDGVEGLAELFLIIAVAPRRKLAIPCRHCRFLGPDEGRFLQLVGLLQRRHFDEAAAILSQWVVPGAARLALSPTGRLADGLARRGLIVPPRRWPAPSAGGGFAGSAWIH